MSHTACRQGITAVYHGFMQDLDLAHHDGRYKRVMRPLAKGELLILDWVLHDNAYKIELKGESMRKQRTKIDAAETM